MHRRVPFVVAAVTVMIAMFAAAPLPASAASQTVTVRYGPWTIPAGTMEAPGEITNSLSAAAKPCGSCDIVGERPDLVYADGTSANMDTGPMLHHFVIGNLAARDLVCPAQPMGDRLWASGNERTAKEFPPGYGVAVRGTDRWVLLADLMNYSAAPKTVYLSVTYTIAGARTTTPVRSVWLDAGGCLSSAYSVPAGPSTRTWTWPATVGGRLVFLNGHQHADGVHVSATDDTTRTVLCDSYAEYEEMGGMRAIVRMGVCAGDPVATIRPGDRVTVRSYYDSPAAQTGVMGIIHAYLAV
ncbi:hypothetical protein MF672_025420 [Actinomadura sp. ATCC 31491]|uniref:Uncharacterized protein n=1 Tax=Actinomadura luzonensis TaxID=2805427 RepID=A0ABT0FXN1_9ACTN|nr:hypothetical protein [Actinomadura luzonensis]MCK2217107.1 hypothetical protein [Actinomadura luzonensis]